MREGNQSPIPRPSPFELERFARAINARQFYEAHEIMEEVWVAMGRPRPSFAQGLVQLAAGLEQLKRSHRQGAKKLMERGLQNCRLDPGHYPFAQSFIHDMQDYSDMAFRGPYPQISEAFGDQ